MRRHALSVIGVLLLAAVLQWTGDTPVRAQPPEDRARESVEKQEHAPETSPEGLFEQARRARTGEEAEAAYRGFLDRFPEHELADDARFALAMQYYSLGYYRTAEREFAVVTEEYPGGDRAEDAGYWHGVVLLALGQIDAAMEKFGWVMDRYPSSEKSAWARIGIADAFRLRGDLPEAARAYEEILDRFPSADLESATLFHLAEVYGELGDPARARSVYARLSDIYPETWEGVQATARLGTPAPAPAPASVAGSTAPEPDRERDARADRTPDAVEGPAAGEPSAPAAETAPEDAWIVQVGAFAMQENAERLARVLSAQHYPDVRVEPDRLGAQVFHKVLVGRFLSEDEAGAMAGVLRHRHNLETRVFMRTE